MQYNKKISRHLPLILATSLLTACGGGGGGGGGGSNEESSAKTGVFLDSAVNGMSYRTSTQSGTTNSAGEFQYEDNEIVSFSIGELLLGSYIGRESITPVELANAFRSDDELSVNIARLLQTLDADQNPDNGIELIAAARNLSDTIDLNDISSIQSGLDSLSAGLTLVSADDALAHLNATLSGLPAPQLAASYSYVTAQNNLDSVCTAELWNGATLDVSGAGETTAYSGTVTKVDGSIESFNLDKTGRGVTDAGSTISIGADEFAAKMSVRPSVTANCFGEIHLTTNDAVNLPPIAGRSSKFTIGICNSANGFYDFGFDGYAGDRDGYIAKHPTFKYTVDGEAPVELVVGANGLVASGYGAKAAVRIDRAEILDTRCTKGFTWEYIVEDNEGAISIATGSREAPFEDDGSGNGDFCADDYPKGACDLIDGASFSAGATCASAFPSADALGDFACTGDSAFSSCGACLIDSSANLRNASEISEHASDTLYRALGQQ